MFGESTSEDETENIVIFAVTTTIYCLQIHSLQWLLKKLRVLYSIKGSYEVQGLFVTLTQV